MPTYPDWFESEDRTRVFKFLALFSRWEYALKTGAYVKAGGHGQAEANWRQFATDHEAAIAALNDISFQTARDALLAKPPKRLDYVNGSLAWQANPRRQDETGADYLLRVVRDVRNNLFHGGKYSGGPEPELSRDRQLIDSATCVLETVAAVNHDVLSKLNERGARAVAARS